MSWPNNYINVWQYQRVSLSIIRQTGEHILQPSYRTRHRIVTVWNAANDNNNNNNNSNNNNHSNNSNNNNNTTKLRHTQQSPDQSPSLYASCSARWAWSSRRTCTHTYNQHVTKAALRSLLLEVRQQPRAAEHWRPRVLQIVSSHEACRMSHNQLPRWPIRNHATTSQRHNDRMP